MKKMTAVFLCLFLAFAAACSSDGPHEREGADGFFDGLLQDLPSPLDDQEERTLELAMFKHQEIEPVLKLMVDLFMQKYPHITVNATVIGDAGTYADTLKKMILSGDYSPDLFIAPVYDEFLDDVNMHGRLLDIYALMDVDSHFDETEWFMQPIHAFSRDGELYELPIHVMPVFFNINNRVSDELTEDFAARDDVTFRELINIFEQNAAGRSMFAGQSKKSIHKYFSGTKEGTPSEYQSEDVSQAADIFFDGAEYIKLLEFTNNLLATETAAYNWDYEPSNVVNSIMEGERGKSFLFERSRYSAAQYILPMASLVTNFSGMVPLANERGNIFLEKQEYPMRFSVCAASSQPELAWELVKFFASDAYYEHLYESGKHIPGMYFGTSMFSYLSVYKPTLRYKLGLQYGPYINSYGMQTYKINFTVPEGDRANYMTDWVERLMLREFVYMPDDWLPRALFDAFVSYLTFADTEFAAPLEEILPRMRSVYTDMLRNDPTMQWIREISESDENRQANPWMYGSGYGYTVNERERMEYILQSEFLKMIFLYAFFDPDQ
ncbi:MAG: extracellular solute-binding protein [Defluviitaleaceae bacterium]|nr:extracellular solute-binding protein [Defluviitaleaceae bacterium]